jgi:hypothetical protein
MKVKKNRFGESINTEKASEELGIEGQKTWS